LKTPETGKTKNIAQSVNQPKSSTTPHEPVEDKPQTNPAALKADNPPSPPPHQSAEQQLVALLPQIKLGDFDPKAYAADLERLMEQFIPQINSIPLTLSQEGVYRDNDSIKFKLNLPSSGFLHVFIVEPNGKATLIFPSEYAKNNRVGPGPINLPNGRPPILAGPPYGKSWFMAFTVADAINLYQQYAKDKTRVKDGLLELRVWEVLGFLERRLGDSETKIVGATIHICAKTGPCPISQ
jgi:hypothetical protein